MKRKAIICDIDNCIIDVSKIEKEIEKNNFNLYDFFEPRANDTEWVQKISNIFELIKLYHSQDYEIILLTARSKRLQQETYKFLTSGAVKLPRDILIISRGLDEEGIPDYILKESKLKKIIEDFDIELAIDDKQANCDMFKRNGIFTLKVVLDD